MTRRELEAPYCAELLMAVLPGSRLQGPRADAPLAPTPASCVASVMKGTLRRALCLQAGGGASVVGERVPQEDEDQDDARGGQGGAGDVEQPGCLGVFHRPVQVIEKLLVPNLRPQRRGEPGVDQAGGRAGGRTARAGAVGSSRP